MPDEVKPDAVLPGDAVQDEGGDASLSSTPEEVPPDSSTLSPPEPDPQLTLAGITASHSDAYAGFDPSKHATNEDGTPKRKTDGTYALKRGRKAGSVAASALPPRNAALPAAAGAPVVNSNEEPTQLSPDMAAQQHANMLINVTCWTLGEEVGKPTGKDESLMLKLSFRNYYEAKGVPNIPPELGLVFGILAYVGPRLIHENSLTKFAKVKLWIAAKFGK